MADIQQEQNNMLSYEGVISGQENKIYFAGYSEPIIKKIDSDGNIVFSKSTIDNYDTSANYAKTQSGDLSNNLLSYTPGALFSSLDLDVCDEHLFIIPHYNDDESFKYLDLYSSIDGKYLETYTTDHFLTSLTVDSANVYAITVGDGTKFISKFDNPSES
ncbi:MAG: hypothetical protein U5J95_02665 [Balneolaceae bacterium]|nr:hypothetical protein [Balneolaceae bacterium]